MRFKYCGLFYKKWKHFGNIFQQERRPVKGGLIGPGVRALDATWKDGRFLGGGG